jgi:hypothetical protein
MPRGPKGEKRPADVIGNVVHVMRIATGEIQDVHGKAPKRAEDGLKGGKARAMVLTPEQRADIARAASAARWKKLGSLSNAASDFHFLDVFLEAEHCL